VSPHAQLVSTKTLNRRVISYVKIENKKVSYRKQIARQHSCNKNFYSGQGAWSTLKNYSPHPA